MPEIASSQSITEQPDARRRSAHIDSSMAKPVVLRAQLDCQSCYEPFSPAAGPRYPRILAPCAHTFCTECIEKQIQARGAEDFRCLTHNQHVAISKAEDVKANFALIELLELIEKDADHQVVDERTKPPSCSECDELATCYCKTDDACFCDAHRASMHSGKAHSKHVIVPVADRTASVVPKCPTHKSKDLDLWCTQCSALCCTMCERTGVHKEHTDKLLPVDDGSPHNEHALQVWPKRRASLRRTRWKRRRRR